MILRNAIGALFITTLSLMASACGESADAVAENAESAEIHVGSSCEGIGAATGRYHCDGQQVLFCSSATDYVYTEMTLCGDDKTCVVAEDGTSSSCE